MRGSDRIIRRGAWRVLLVALLLLPFAPRTRGGEPTAQSARVAMKQGDAELLEEYLDQHGDPDLADPAGNTLLHQAAELGREHMVGLLLRAGADPMTRNRMDCTPLHMAALKDQAGAVRALVDGGALVDAPGFSPPDGYSASTPLILAAEMGAGGSARVLLELGANPNAVNAFDRTPLFWARKAGQREMVALLEAAGARAAPEEALAAGGVRSAELDRGGGGGSGSAGHAAGGASRGSSGPEVMAVSLGEAEGSGPVPPGVEGPGTGERAGAGAGGSLEERPLGHAVARWRRAVERSPRDPRALLNLGIAYRKAGRPRRAHRALKQAVEFAPRDAVARSHLCLVLLELGRSDLARGQLDAVTRLDPAQGRKLRAALRRERR